MIIDLGGKHVLVTGGARGIGAAIARGVCHAGGGVIIVDCERDEAARVRDELGPSCQVLIADLGSPEQVPAIWQEALRLCGHIDVLVNNAGIYEPAACAGSFNAWATSWRHTLDVNLLAPAHFCREAINHFRQNGGGHIINIASRAAFRGDDPDYPHYAASKSGLVALTKTIARGFAREGVCAYSIAPGFVDTHLHDDLFRRLGREATIGDLPLGEMAKPEDIAALVVFVASGSARHATGATFDINGASYVR
jgi:3-oxoacyl-[acyl-carrier protein] reductase